MGVRFRRSVKICKGVKINFSKSGASLSLGGPGCSINFSKNGTRVTTGISGTGLSYSTKLPNLSNNTLSPPARNTSGVWRPLTVPLPGSVQLSMNREGKVAFLDARGYPIYNQAYIRNIMATDSYKSAVQYLERQRQITLAIEYERAKIDNNRFVEIHKLSPPVITLKHFIEILNNLKPHVYQKKQFNVPFPSEGLIRDQLIKEANEKVQGNVFTVGKRRKMYVELNLQNRLNAAISWWKQQKEAFDSKEVNLEATENKRFIAESVLQSRYLKKLIDGEGQAVCECVEDWISSCELPVEINVDYEWHQNTHIMYLDVDLPEIEDIPENEAVRLANGSIVEKKKTQAILKQEYVKLVFGLAIFICSNIFNISPAIHRIVISGYTQRRDKIGEIVDEYVYSIKFTRNIFENTILPNVDPKDFCMRFENRCNVTNSMIMKKIKPYETDNEYKEDSQTTGKDNADGKSRVLSSGASLVSGKMDSNTTAADDPYATLFDTSDSNIGKEEGDSDKKTDVVDDLMGFFEEE